MKTNLQKVLNESHRFQGEEKDKLFAITSFFEGKLLFRYFSVPIIAGRFSSSDCQLLVDKVIGRIRRQETRNSHM